MDIRRLYQQDIPNVHALMIDVVSRLSSDALFVMNSLEYLYDHVYDLGEIYGAYHDERLVAFTVLAFPGHGASNLGREFGVPEVELSKVASFDGTVVHESVRGQGLQRHFHEWREQRAREKECLYLYATVHPENYFSRKNLETAGFTLRFTRPMYGGLPRHCYVKKLD